MPIKLLEYANRTKRITVTLPEDEGSFDVWYRVAVLTPAFMTKMEAIEKEDGNNERAVEMICNLVEKWDILDEEGERVPVTPMNVRTFSYKLLTPISKAVMADMVPDPTPAAAIGSFS